MRRFVNICLFSILLIFCIGCSKSNSENNIATLFSAAAFDINNIDLNINNNDSRKDIYFSSDTGINRLDKASGKVLNILTSTDRIRPYVYNDSIYYSKKAEDENSIPIYNRIYRCSIDGLNNELIWDSEVLLNSNNDSDLNLRMEKLGYLSGFHVIGDNIYILMTEGLNSTYLLISYNMKTQENKLFLDGGLSYSFLDGYCYYTEKFGKTYTIYKKDLSTWETEIVRGNGYHETDLTDLDIEKNIYYEDVITSGNEIYYITRFHSKIYKLSDKDILIFDADQYLNSVIKMYAFSDKLYFTLSSNNENNSLSEHKYLYEYNPNNNHLNLITEIAYNAKFVVIGNELYIESFDNNKNQSVIQRIDL